jgi:hypothetical protein
MIVNARILPLGDQIRLHWQGLSFGDRAALLSLYFKSLSILTFQIRGSGRGTCEDHNFSPSAE